MQWTRKIIVVVLGCFVSVCAFSQEKQNKHAGQKTKVTMISKETLLADIDEYGEQISKHHVDPFTITTKHDFFDGLQRIKDSVATYNVDQMLVELLKVNASIHDEHTNINYYSRVRYPFNFYWFEDGLYICWVTDNNRKLLYSKLLEINGMPVEQVVERLRQIIPDTNAASIKDKLPHMLPDPFVLHGIGISQSRKDVVLTLQTIRKDTIQVTPEPQQLGTYKLNGDYDRMQFLRWREQRNYWYTYMDTSSCLYFNYSSCFNERDYPLSKLVSEMKETIEKRHPERIVIDLRENGGGYPSLLEPFVDYLSRSYLNKKGKIWVLIGRRTFSAAVMGTEFLKERTHAITVGEPTSGSTQFFTGVQEYTLPNTQLMGSYSISYYASGEKYHGSLRPDIYIPERFDDYVRAIDAPLQYALLNNIFSP